ncbi:MAG: protein-L-isoaspartate(D-aspartate) O-methyltransferase [Phycisphaerae bacterium]
MLRESQPDKFAPARRQMIERQLRARNITDPRVLKVMSELPRERFIPGESQSAAYEDRAVSIGLGQTISQPYMVAVMTEKLQIEPENRILEIGTGSGYQTAVLAKLATEVYAIERIDELSQRAQMTLTQLGLTNIRYKIDDGTIGWPDASPFDRILVTAGSPQVPEHLSDQLKEGGILIIPVGPEECQTLIRIRKIGNKLQQEPIISCRFVKLIGEQGWPED